MELLGTLPDMDAQVSLRQLVGSIVMDEIARLPGRAKMKRAIELSGLSRSTIYNVRDGVDTVTRDTLGALEGAFGLPNRFFDLVIEGDVERIKALPGRVEDPARGVPEVLRHYVITSLGELSLPRGRRATDRRAR